MTDRHNKTVRKGAKVKSPVKEGSVVLVNKDLFSKFELELRSPDKILQHEGFDYYDKMLDTDAHVYSIITTRKMGAGSFPYKLTPKNDSPEAFEQMTFIQFLLNSIPIENHFFDILDAIPKGFSIHEIVSRPTDENDDFQDKILINRLIFHPQQHFIFKVKKKTGYDLYFKPADFSEEKKLPMENFLHANFDSNSPYGKPLLEKLYWYYWFKKETGFKFWAIFLEKFGGPTAIMKYPSGDTSTKLQTAANEALEDLQNSSGISIPDSFTLDFAKVSQGDISYQNMIDACNAEMSKAALGATQTVEEGRRGSYALSRTHTDVRAEYKLHDVRILRKAIQPQIIDRYTKLNFSNPLPPKIDFIIPANNTVLDKPDPDHKGSVRDDALNLKLIELVDRMVTMKYGGAGSGHFNHPGRPGVVGGSKATGRSSGGPRTSEGSKNTKGGGQKTTDIKNGSSGGGKKDDVKQLKNLPQDVQAVLKKEKVPEGAKSVFDPDFDIADNISVTKSEGDKIAEMIQNGDIEPTDGSIFDAIVEMRGLTDDEFNKGLESIEKVKDTGDPDDIPEGEGDEFLTPGGGTRTPTGRVIGNRVDDVTDEEASAVAAMIRRGEIEPDDGSIADAIEKLRSSKDKAKSGPSNDSKVKREPDLLPTFPIPIGIGADRKLNFINITNPIEIIKKLFTTNPRPKEEPKITESEAIAKVTESLFQDKNNDATPAEVGSVGFMLLRNEIGTDKNSIQQALVNLRKFEALSQKEKNRFLKDKKQKQEQEDTRKKELEGS